MIIKMKKLTMDDLNVAVSALDKAAFRNPIPSEFGVVMSWDYPENKILTDDKLRLMFFNPVTWCLLIRKTNGNDAALEQLRKLLHQRIDQKFNAHRG